jgi:hypothetical protein
MGVIVRELHEHGMNRGLFGDGPVRRRPEAGERNVPESAEAWAERLLGDEPRAPGAKAWAVRLLGA